MRFFYFNKTKLDSKRLIWYLVAVVCAIICGIVLFTLCNISVYFYNFAKKYVDFVFIFNNWPLFISHFISELFFLYCVLLLVYFTKCKLLVLPFIFVKSFFAMLYILIMCSVFATEGIIVTLLVFLPAIIFSVGAMILIAENCKVFKKSLVFFIPLIFALVNSLIFLFFINVPFRVIVVIV